MKLEKYNQLKKIIRDIIIESRGGIDELPGKCVCCYCSDCGYPNDNCICPNYGLSDILIALDDKLEGDYINEGGEIEFIIDEYESWIWNLKDDNLDSQNNETKEYLYKLLVK